MSKNFRYDSEVNGSITLFENVIASFEADEDTVDETPSEEDPVQPSTVEISPPPEELEIKNSDFFIDGKVRDSLMDNDPAIMNLIKIFLV